MRESKNQLNQNFRPFYELTLKTMGIRLAVFLTVQISGISCVLAAAGILVYLVTLH